MNAHDKDLDQPYKAAYAQAVGRARDAYQNAWNDMDEPKRSEYCAAYWNDVRYFSEVKGLIVRGNLLQSVSMFYLGALSPLSDESIAEIEQNAKDKEERDGILGSILLLGQALSLAGGISASNDARAAQKSGDYSLAQMRYEQSRSLLRISSGVGSTVQTLPSMDSPTAPSHQPPQASCQTLDNFDQYNAESESDVWKKYQSLTAGCDALNSLLAK